MPVAIFVQMPGYSTMFITFIFSTLGQSKKQKVAQFAKMEMETVIIYVSFSQTRVSGGKEELEELPEPDWSMGMAVGHILSLSFWNRVSMCSLGCLKTCFVEQTGLRFRDLPLFAP